MRTWAVVSLVALFAVVSGGISIAVGRTWTDATGQHRIEAEFEGFENGRVKLKRADGSVLAVSVGKLSTADQKWVRDELKRRNRAANATETTSTATPETASGDWPEWRGPQRDGVSPSTGLLQKWPEGGPPLLWSSRGLGRGYSSVAVSGGRIYTMGKKDGQVKLICADAEDGSVKWETACGGGDNPNCTPTVDAQSKRVYGLTHQGDLLCADAETGVEVWRKKFADDFGGRMMSGWGFSESPLVDGDRLIVTPGGNDAVLVALDKRTGRLIWSTPMQGSGGAGYASVVISNAAGIKQYITLVGRGLIGVAAADGKLLWHYQRIANGTANVPTPIVEGDFVFASTGYGDGGSALLQLQRGPDGVVPREVYYKRSNELQNHHGGMIRIGDYIYMGHGHNNGLPVCLEWKTGRLKWGPQRGPGSDSAAIIAADGQLYFRYENGVMALIQASPDGYQLNGSFKIASVNGRSWPHPVIANQRLYLRDQDQLHCYDLRAK